MKFQNIFSHFVLSGFIFLLASLAFLNSSAAQNPFTVAVKYKHSEVSFTGDDSFVTSRFTRKPLAAGHIWNERINFSGGVMYYSELNPGQAYTGFNSGIETFRDIFNRNPVFKKRGMSIAVGDIKELSNKTGDYYLAAQKGEKTICGMAKQFSGDTNADIISLGNRVATVYFCKSKSWGSEEKLTANIKGIMDRARYDEGKLNKMRAATR